MMKDRLEEQFAWRKEQLEREVAILLQRKDSIISQMTNLQQMALDVTTAYPNTDPFADAEPAQPVHADPDQQWLTESLQQGVAQPNEPTTVIRSDPKKAPAPVTPEGASSD